MAGAALNLFKSVALLPAFITALITLGLNADLDQWWLSVSVNYILLAAVILTPFASMLYLYSGVMQTLASIFLFGENPHIKYFNFLDLGFLI